MATTPKQTLYPFCEMWEGTSNGTTAVTIGYLPAGTILTGALMIFKTAGVGTGNVMVGDASDSDGIIEEIDGTSAAATVAGDTVTERGAYLYDSTSKANHYKVFTSQTAILLDGDAATLTTEPVVNVILFGYRYNTSV